MPEAGQIRHEVVEEDGTGLPLLHVYLPEGLTNSDVDVSTGTSPDVAEVFIERLDTQDTLGLISLSGYRVAEEGAVKYSKKHRRFAIRLDKGEPAAVPAASSPAAAAAAPAEAAPEASSTGLSSAAASSSPTKPRVASLLAAAAPAATANSFGALENDEVSDDDEAEGGATTAAKKKKKKKKKSKNAGGGGEADGGDAKGAAEEPAANGSTHPDASASGGAGAVSSSAGGQTDATTVPVAAAAPGGEGATGAAKKKKKKKKKAGAAAGASAEAEAEEADGSNDVGGDEAEVEVEQAMLPGRATPPPATPSEGLSPPPSVPVSAPASVPNSAPMSKYASRALLVDLAEDFRDPPCGAFEVGRAVDHDPLLGPALHHGLGKVQVKGEDKWLEAPSNSFIWEGLEGSATPVSAFGIFDGHGGRMAAQHAAKNLLPLVGNFAARSVGPVPPTEVNDLVEAGYLDPASLEVEDAEQQTEAVERAQAAAVQDALIARLPKALHAGFVQCDEEVISRHKASGTTATLAIQVGWELLVANVGDSLAYLDTGTEIVVISANHRVAENTEEQQRILNAGGRIKPAKYDEDEDGPPGTATPHEGQHLRVWPGGINMTRTLGDETAKGLLIPEPAVRQISLPVTGARLIMASDGLWDAVNAKTVIGQLRTCNAREAAHKASFYAMRNKKHDDDVTVVVADFVPREADVHVPGLLKKATGPAAVAVAALAAAGMKEERAAQAWRPLETPSTSWRDRHRAHRQRAAAYLQQLVEAEAAEAEAAEQLERQRRMAVAPAAGTAGVGTAIRPQPLSDTYRELAELRLDLDKLEEPAEAADAGGDWTSVDSNKKKKDASANFDLRREQLKVARPGETRGSTGAGGQADGSGRRDRRDRPRRDRPQGPAGEGAAPAAAVGTEAPSAVPEDGPEAVERVGEQPLQRPQRGDRRRERREPRAGEKGAGRGPRVGGEASTEHPQPTTGGSGAAPAPPPGVVRSGDCLYVPKSLLTGGGGGAVPGGGAVAAAEGAAGDGRGGRARRERERLPRKPRREGGAGPVAGKQDGAAAGDAGQEGGGYEAAAADGSRRTHQAGRNRREVAAASAAAAAAMGGLAPGGGSGGGAPLAAAGEARPAAEHKPRRQPAPQRGADPTSAAASHSKPPQQQQQPHKKATEAGTHAGQPGGERLAEMSSHGPAAPVSYQQPPSSQHAQHPVATHQQQPQYDASQQQQQQQHRQRAPAAPAPAAPVATFTGPMDFGAGFGAGFGPGGGSWQPPSGGQYGGFPSATGTTGNTNTVSSVPQRPAGLAPVSGIQGPRDPQEVAAAAAAAAAAAVARKVAAGGRGGGAPGGGGAGRGNYATGRG